MVDHYFEPCWGDRWTNSSVCFISLTTPFSHTTHILSSTPVENESKTHAVYFLHYTLGCLSTYRVCGPDSNGVYSRLAFINNSCIASRVDKGVYATTYTKYDIRGKLLWMGNECWASNNAKCWVWAWSLPGLVGELLCLVNYTQDAQVFIEIKLQLRDATHAAQCSCKAFICKSFIQGSMVLNNGLVLDTILLTLKPPPLQTTNPKLWLFVHMQGGSDLTSQIHVLLTTVNSSTLITWHCFNCMYMYIILLYHWLRLECIWSRLCLELSGWHWRYSCSCQ